MMTLRCEDGSCLLQMHIGRRMKLGRKDGRRNLEFGRQGEESLKPCRKTWQVLQSLMEGLVYNIKPQLKISEWEDEPTLDLCLLCVLNVLHVRLAYSRVQLSQPLHILGLVLLNSSSTSSCSSCKR